MNRGTSGYFSSRAFPFPFAGSWPNLLFVRKRSGRARPASPRLPRQAILTEAKKHDLVVMGVGRRSGDKLFFGDTAAAVCERSPASIVFVAS